MACAGFALAIGVPAVASAQTAAPASCPIQLGFMKAGVANDSAQVTRLQTYLKASEGADVDVNGTFDQKTEQAVMAFQKKYMSDVMSPWEATRSSGIVYITTVKKINQLACGVPLSLDEKELGVIGAYKSALASSDGSMVPAISAAALDGSQPGLTATNSTLGPTVPSDQTNGVQQAAAVSVATNTTSVPLWHRFLSFVKHLFVR